MSGPDPVRLEQLRRGEAFALGLVATLDDRQLAEPSGLPGWTRAHVVGHLARNADALGNLLSWARTGTPSPMYRSAGHRAAGIEDSAKQEPSDLRTDAEDASTRLLAAVDALPADAWSARVRTGRGVRVAVDQGSINHLLLSGLPESRRPALQVVATRSDAIDAFEGESAARK